MRRLQHAHTRAAGCRPRRRDGRLKLTQSAVVIESTRSVRLSLATTPCHAPAARATRAVPPPSRSRAGSRAAGPRCRRSSLPQPTRYLQLPSYRCHRFHSSTTASARDARATLGITSRSAAQQQPPLRSNRSRVRVPRRALALGAAVPHPAAPPAHTADSHTGPRRSGNHQAAL
jgi:hypothetical protein